MLIKYTCCAAEKPRVYYSSQFPFHQFPPPVSIYLKWISTTFSYYFKVMPLEDCSRFLSIYFYLIGFNKWERAVITLSNRTPAGINQTCSVNLEITRNRRIEYGSGAVLIQTPRWTHFHHRGTQVKWHVKQYFLPSYASRRSNPCLGHRPPSGQGSHTSQSGRRQFQSSSPLIYSGYLDIANDSSNGRRN